MAVTETTIIANQGEQLLTWSVSGMYDSEATAAGEKLKSYLRHTVFGIIAFACFVLRKNLRENDQYGKRVN